MPIASLDLSGIHVPLVTPFDPVTGDVDPVGLRSNIRKLLHEGVNGFVVSGSTGEGVLLDEGERLTLLEAARGVVPADRLLLAGVGAESTRTTVRLARMAGENGADAVLVMPPVFYRVAMTPEALREHFLAVADESPVPVILYRVAPPFTMVDLPSGLIAELARHPNVVGIQEARGALDEVGELLDCCPKGFQVLVGTAPLLYGALEMGAAGGILAVAHMAPGASVALLAAVRGGRAPEAGRLQQLIGPLHKEVVGALGIAGLKVALDLLGQRGGRPRPPLRPLPDKRREDVRGALQRAGLLPSVDAPPKAE